MAQHLNYEVENRKLIAETPELKVVELTLGPGQAVPWHYHRHITDTFYCLEGPMVVQTQGGRSTTELAAGESCAVPPRTAHRVFGKDNGRCRFAIVQGVGEYDYMPIDE